MGVERPKCTQFVTFKSGATNQGGAMFLPVDTLFSPRWLASETLKLFILTTFNKKRNLELVMLFLIKDTSNLNYFVMDWLDRNSIRFD